MKLYQHYFVLLFLSLATHQFTAAQCSLETPVVADLNICSSAQMPTVTAENTPSNALVRWYSSDNVQLAEAVGFTPNPVSGEYYCSFVDGACESTRAKFTVNLISPRSPVIDARSSGIDRTCALYDYYTEGSILGTISATCNGAYDRLIWNLPDGIQSVGSSIDVKYENVIDYKHVVSVYSEYTSKGTTCRSDIVYDTSFAVLRPPIIHAPLYYPADKPLILTAEFDLRDKYRRSSDGSTFEWEDTDGTKTVNDTFRITKPKGIFSFNVREYSYLYSCHSDKTSFDIIFGNWFPVIDTYQYYAQSGEPNPKMEIRLAPGTSVQWRDSSGTIVSSDASYTSAESKSGKYTYNLYFSYNNSAYKPLGQIQLSIGNWLSGYAYNDMNKNNIKDADEEGIPGQTVQYGSTKSYITDSDGRYFFEAISGNNRLVTFHNFPYKTIGTNYSKYPNKPVFNTQYVSIINNKPAKLDLPYYIYSDQSDVSVTLTQGVARPGFSTKMWVGYRTIGSGSSSYTIELEYDSTLTFQNASELPKTQRGSILRWEIPSTSRSGIIEIDFGVPADVALLGDTLQSKASIACVANEFDCTNNTAEAQRIVTGSYDPNLLVAAPSYGKRCVIPMDSSITYTVYFQNEGSDTAFSVAIVDTISTQLDLSTIKVIASSHPVEMSLSDRTATFSFDNIYLPDAKTNESESQGFVQFSVQPKSYMLPNTPVSNKAEIFFDFNPPIVTNTYNSLYFADIFDDTTEIVTMKIIRDTLFAGVSVYCGYPSNYNDHCEIISTSSNAGKLNFHQESLSPEYFEYHPKAGFAGTDTIVLKNTAYDEAHLPDTTILIFTIVPFKFEQKTLIPVDLITSMCSNNGMYSPTHKHEIIGDSIFFSGTIVAGCCSKRVALAEYDADTINISFELTDFGCTCDCEFGYRFALPLQGNEKMIRYSTGIARIEDENKMLSVNITISPNPSNGIIHITSDIVYDAVKIYTLDGALASEKQYASTLDLTDLPQGIYRAVFIKKGETVGSEEFVLTK